MRVYDGIVGENGTEHNERLVVFITADDTGVITSKTSGDRLLVVDRTGYTFVIHKDDFDSLDNYKIVDGELTPIE